MVAAVLSSKCSDLQGALQYEKGAVVDCVFGIDNYGMDSCTKLELAFLQVLNLSGYHNATQSLCIIYIGCHDEAELPMAAAISSCFEGMVGLDDSVTIKCPAVSDGAPQCSYCLKFGVDE